MSGDILVPTLGESVTEATVAKWFKKAGDAVSQDEPLVELETDKVTLEVNAPASGVLTEVVVPEGKNVEVGALLGKIAAGAAAAAKPAATASAPAAAPASAPAAAPQTAAEPAQPGPAARKLAEENGISITLPGTGKDGRLTKGDVLQAASAPAPMAAPAPAPAQTRAPAAQGVREERVKMTKLRQAIARRLKESQNTAAMLTTFNEIDMSALMALRSEYKDAFEKKHGVKLGFMSFFTKAVIHALKEIPAVNAHIDGEEIVYKNYYDIGVAVGTEQGLVVPIVRDADSLDLAGIEREIGNLAKRAREGKLGMSELSGGTFTITNGGVYGSLMSTPIINPPQSGILGMHKIEERPIAVKGQVVVRPMMYVALSYDHRIIDGSESVTFLVRVKEALEDPRRLLLGL